MKVAVCFLLLTLVLYANANVVEGLQDLLKQVVNVMGQLKDTVAGSLKGFGKAGRGRQDPSEGSLQGNLGGLVSQVKGILPGILKGKRSVPSKYPQKYPSSPKM